MKSAEKKIHTPILKDTFNTDMKVILLKSTNSFPIINIFNLVICYIISLENIFTFLKIKHKVKLYFYFSK